MAASFSRSPSRRSVFLVEYFSASSTTLARQMPMAANIITEATRQVMLRRALVKSCLQCSLCLDTSQAL